MLHAGIVSLQYRKRAESGHYGIAILDESGIGCRIDTDGGQSNGYHGGGFCCGLCCATVFR